MKDRASMGMLIGAVAMLVLLVVIGFVVVFTGAYNVAATDPHARPVAWALDTPFHNSLQSRAEDIQPPSAFTAAMIAAGAGEYKAMCQHCHGGIGVTRDEWAEGLRPSPPELERAADRWSPPEVFWIVKHGVKMTAMPAFGPTHDDATIWNITAFVKALPHMSPQRYAAFEAEHERHESGGAAHEHPAGEAGHSH